jgi:hypothetical protein
MAAAIDCPERFSPQFRATTETPTIVTTLAWSCTRLTAQTVPPRREKCAMPISASGAR